MISLKIRHAYYRSCMKDTYLGEGKQKRVRVRVIYEGTEGEGEKERDWHALTEKKKRAERRAREQEWE